MTDPQILARLNDYTALALTLWAEARGEPIDGLVGVGWVIKNRLAHHPRYRATTNTYKGVVLAPMQFSCWNAGTDANHVRLMALAERVILGREIITEPAWLECAWVAFGLGKDRLRDPTKGSTHYLTTELYRSKAAPSWSKRLSHTVTLGNHTFLVEPAERRTQDA